MDFLDKHIDKTFRIAPAYTVRMLLVDVSPLADPFAMSAAMQQLSTYRKTKADTYKHSLGKQLSVGAALLLNQLLKPYGLREHDMTYSEGLHGKPLFTNAPELRFCLSHSGTKVAAAIMEGDDRCLLGLDIQSLTKTRLGVARKVFTPDDYILLTNIPCGQSQDALFTQLWSEYEAKGKAFGTGLTWPAQPDNSNHVIHLINPFTNLEASTRQLVYGYHASLCVILSSFLQLTKKI